MPRRRYSQPPLPFTGNKRNWSNRIEEIFKLIPDETSIIVDVFGGSGILSNWVKFYKPELCIIYNDFDNYSSLFQDQSNIDKINGIIKGAYDLVPNELLISKHNFFSRSVHPEIYTALIDYFANIRNNFDIDWLNSAIKVIKTGFCFSSKQILDYDHFLKIINSGLYISKNLIKYKADTEYLQDIEIIHKDYRELYNDYKNIPNVLFIVDPPYLNSNNSQYTKMGLWNIAQHLRVLMSIKDKKYIYFNNKDSGIQELMDLLDIRYDYLYECVYTSSQNTQRTEVCFIKYN